MWTIPSCANNSPNFVDFSLAPIADAFPLTQIIIAKCLLICHCDMHGRQATHSIRVQINHLNAITFVFRFALKCVNNCSAVSLFNCEPVQGQLTQHPNGMLHCANWRSAVLWFIFFVSIDKRTMIRKWSSVELVNEAAFFCGFVAIQLIGVFLCVCSHSGIEMKSKTSVWLWLVSSTSSTTCMINSMRFSIVHFTCAYCRLDICHTAKRYTHTWKTPAIPMRARHFAHSELNGIVELELVRDCEKRMAKNT